MSFINKKTDTAVVRAKLTERGRELLSEGNLTYRFWAIGDSEVDYNFIFNANEDASNFQILSPKDRTESLKHPIPQFSGGDVYNTLQATNVAPKNVYGQNIIKGFFTKNGSNYSVDTTKFKAVGTAVNGTLAGSKTLSLTLTRGEIKVGDILILGVPSAQQSSIVPNTITPTPISYLGYKIITVPNATSVTLDRELPLITTGTANCSVYVIHGDDPINNFYSTYEPTYWDYDNLSFQTNDNKVANDVPVWNFNVVLTENLAGIVSSEMNDINEYAGRFFAGFKNFITTGGYNDKKILGIVHFSNNMTSNVYGEFFKAGSFKLHLPTILWHKNNQGTGNGTVMGLTLVSQIVEGEEYDNLIDGLGNIVGKVFRNDQIAVIEDEELVTAMSYKSNRNWTLPTIDSTMIPTTGGNTLVGDNQDFYCTYLFTNTTGLKNAIQCMNYSKVGKVGVGSENVRLTFPKNQLPFMKTATTNGGFTATKMYLLMQLVASGQRPVSNNWKILEVTTDFGGNGTANMNPASIELGTKLIDKTIYNNAPIYKISNQLGGYTEVNSLNFGDENILFGTVEAIPSAKVYKTSFVLNLSFNQFRESNNPTFDSDGGNPVFISEVGIYNGDNELVLIGKLNKPLKKENSDVILLQLEVDF